MNLPILYFALLGLLISSAPALGWQNDASNTAALPEEVIAEFTDGQTLAGKIVALDQNGVALVSQSETQRFTFDQLSSLKFVGTDPNDDVSTVDPSVGKVSFVDGTEIMTGTLSIDQGNATMTSIGNTQIQSDVSQLITVSMFDAAATPQDRAQWESLLKQPRPTADAIVISKNGKLQMIEGIVGDISSEHLTFSMETRRANVAIEKIKGVIFYRADRELTDPICKLILTDQSQIQTRALRRSTDGVGLVATTVGGVEISVRSNKVSRLDFSVGRSVYLSDLIPTTNDWTPLIASPEIVDQLKTLRIARFNKDFRGDRIALDSIPQSGVEYLGKTQSFDKGIAISGGGRVVFSVNRQFKRLTGWVGLDPRAYQDAVVKLTIKTDGKTAISEVLRARKLLQPIALDVDVSSTDRISISAQYEDGKVAGDVIHLGDLKVSR